MSTLQVRNEYNQVGFVPSNYVRKENMLERAKGNVKAAFSNGRQRSNEFSMVSISRFQTLFTPQYQWRKNYFREDSANLWFSVYSCLSVIWLVCKHRPARTCRLAAASQSGLLLILPRMCCDGGQLICISSQLIFLEGDILSSQARFSRKTAVASSFKCKLKFLKQKNAFHTNERVAPSVLFK